ncbi:1-Acylglycerol-3-phosphate O-acyltransferase 3 [Carabus blaptoides fortunei]
MLCILFSNDIYCSMNYLGKEHAFSIVNHCTDIEWLFSGIVSERVGCSGNFKAYIKRLIQYWPAIGWCLFLSESVFLSRTFDKDKEIIGKQISELVDHPDPIWLLLFPEGTRYTPNKHEVSVKYARERGLPVFKHHLTPRVNGFLASLPAMRGKMGAIYDTTLVFKPNAQIKPAVTSLLFGQKLECHMYIKRIPFGTVPEHEKEASKFLYEMFEIKDKLKDSFINTGDFFATSGVKREEPVKLKSSYSVFLCTMFSYCVVMLPTLYYILQFLFTATLTSISYIFGICSVVFFLLYAMVTVIWKGSSYGTAKKTK